MKLFVFILLFIYLTGCGVKAPPLPPEEAPHEEVEPSPRPKRR